MDDYSLKNFALFLFLTLAYSNPAFAYARCDTCSRDKHGRILRHISAKSAFKMDNPCPLNGKTKGACNGYVIDHIIPLKRGGADTPINMQWQTKEGARLKDKWE